MEFSEISYSSLVKTENGAYEIRASGRLKPDENAYRALEFLRAWVETTMEEIEETRDRPSFVVLGTQVIATNLIKSFSLKEILGKQKLVVYWGDNHGEVFEGEQIQDLYEKLLRSVPHAA